MEFSEPLYFLLVSQQHGSVFWKRGASQTLKQLNPDQTLHQLLQVCACSSVLCDQTHVWFHVPADSGVLMSPGQLLCGRQSSVDGLQQQSTMSGPGGSNRGRRETGRDHRIQSL